MLVEISLPAGLLRSRLQTLGVLGYGQLVDDLLDVTIHEDGQVVHRVVDAVVCHTGLGVVVGADLTMVLRFLDISLRYFSYSML